MRNTGIRNHIGTIENLDQAKQVIDLLIETIETQQAQLDALQSQVRPHSQNSSKAPSSDTPEQRQKRPSKKASGKKPGAQPGHKGQYRQLHPESDVTEFHDIYPGSCACGGHIQLTGQAPYRKQHIDLPVVKPIIHEHRLHHGQCSHCHAQQYARLPQSQASTIFGAQLHATVALLSAQFHLSDRMIQSYLKAFYNLSISLGSISNLQGRTTIWLWPLAQAIRSCLRQSPVVHADETTHWRNRERRWLWVLVNTQAAYFQTHYSRGKQAAENLLGAEFSNILISDRLGSYNIVDEQKHQYCIAHLIRNFRKMAQKSGIDGQIGQNVQSLLQLLIRLDHRRQQGLEHRHFRRRCYKVKDTLTKQLRQGVLSGQKQTRGQCEKLLDDLGCVFTFVRYPGIALTNNEAERAIRPYVIWRKSSFSSKSARGDQFRAYMLSIVETCKRQGTSALEVLIETCTQGLNGEAIRTSVFADQQQMLLEG